VKPIVNFDKTILDSLRKGNEKPGFSTHLSVINKSYCRNRVSDRNRVSQLIFLLLTKVIAETRFLDQGIRRVRKRSSHPTPSVSTQLKKWIGDRKHLYRSALACKLYPVLALFLLSTPMRYVPAFRLLLMVSSTLEKSDELAIAEPLLS